MEEYEKVQYSRGQIKKAGEALANCSKENIGEDSDFLKIVDNWRAAHAFPLNEIYKLINQALKDQNGIMVVQRLKRLESIVGKLQRHNHTVLIKMQDLGGCRVIVQEVQEIYNVVNILKICLEEQGHEIQKEYDYLDNPPESSGYRSYHIVVKYKGSNEYDGMLIEIQVRTRLQNSWATAVEIIDFITNETLKAGTGNEKYRYFFKLASALFSIKEQTTIVQGVPKKHEEIVKEIYQIEREERIREKLSAYSTAITLPVNYEEGTVSYFLLIIDMRSRGINMTAYKPNEIKEAIEQYHKVEKIANKNGIDVVLVAGHSLGSLKESYQNYFLGAQSFLASIAEMCSIYPETPSIILDLKNKSRKVSDYFKIHHYDRSTPEGVHLEEDGIGISESKLYFCPTWPISLQDSYLRYSGICISEEKLTSYPNTKPIHIMGPCIIVSRMGASFFVDKKDLYYISDADTAVISPKDDTAIEQLLLLLCWIKSNIFTWDLLWNKYYNSIYYKKVFDSSFFPNLEGEKLEIIIHFAQKVLYAEKKYVKGYNEGDENGDLHNSIEEMEAFNKDMLEYLKRMELTFAEYYNISAEDLQIIAHELKMKGFFSYLQPT